MLAGYLPFDDDPANPEGDNINLLYKYITTTALTFPEYVTPHARDLLRRILQPDPRKRADLFEVARHSWLQEYHHVVSHITSSTTNVADIANATVPLETSPGQPSMNRSVSVREPSKLVTRSPDPRIANQDDQVGAIAGPEAARQKSTRHTLQPEYVAPSTHTSRGPAPNAASTTAPPSAYQKPLPQDPPIDTAMRSPSGQKMPPPSRPGREVPRSVSDSTGAFVTAAASSGPSAYEQVTQQVTRPSTGGTMTSAAGLNGTRSDLRLPSRGSYGQPVAPTVAATNAQGRVTQPTKYGRGYNISGPMPQHTSHQSIGQPMTQTMPQQSMSPANKEKMSTMPPPATAGKGHHRRSSTLSGLGERLFGRSMSTRRKDKEDPVQKNGRRYPPTAMKQYTEDGGGANPRASIDSKRSFSFGLGKKRSSDLESHSGEKANRRFSLLPNSVSHRLFGGSRDQINETSSPQTSDFPQPPSNSASRPSTNQRPTEDYQQNYSTGNDGSRDYREANNKNYSRPSNQGYSQPQEYSQPKPASNDVYGGTGVYGQDQRQAQNQQAYSQNQYRQSQLPPQASYRQPQGQSQRPVYPQGFNSSDAAPPRQSMQQGRPAQSKLTKNNRKFNDGYGDQGSHSGSSGAVKKVQDFFRRRGRARADSDVVY
jgi:protein-serine/threonine kinase